jgi:hypothetical protein
MADSFTQCIPARHPVFEDREAAHISSGHPGIVPEGRIGAFRFKLGYLSLSFAEVKDAPLGHRVLWRDQ